MSDSASTVSAAQVARLAGTTRAAFTQWRRRHADFPVPVEGDSDRFDLNEVIGWLDGRLVPARRRAPDEAADATYGDRVRRQLRPTERPDADLLFRSLLALGSQVCGDAPFSDYLYLLLCLGFLRLYDGDRWVQLTRVIPSSGDPSDAERLLRSVVAAVDRSLGYPELLRGRDTPAARLRPVAYEPVRKVMELAAGLLPPDIRRLHAAFVREVCVHGAIWTPASVTRTMVALLTNHTAPGNVIVYDPFARFGELVAEFVEGSADRAAVRVCIEHPYPADLRLAGMRLAAAGTRAELATTPSPPPGGATVLLTNPPFGGQHKELEWLQQCVASLAEDGHAAVLMPYSAGFGAGARARDVRRELVERGAVLAVVALPAKMFRGTSVGVCVWLLRHPTGHAAPVQLVDARKLGRPSSNPPMGVHVLDAADTATIAATVATSERRPGFSVLAPADEIRARRYSLYPPEYQDRSLVPTGTDAARAELDELFVDHCSPSYTTGGKGWPRHRLDDICDIRPGVPHVSLKRAISRARTAYKAVPVVHPRHLRDGLIHGGDAPDADVASLAQHGLQTGDVLCVRTGAMGQTAIVRPGESGWLPHANLLRLRVKETAELEPAYLLAYLSQPAVQGLIQNRSVRSVTTSISSVTLGDLDIPLPPLADQQRILSALQSLDEQTAAIERRLNAAHAARTAFARHLTDGTVILAEGEASE